MKTKWVKLVERESDYWKNHMMNASIARAGSVFGFSVDERITTRCGMTFTHWLDPEDVRRCSDRILKHTLHSPVLLMRMTDEFRARKRALTKCARQLEHASLKGMSAKELLRLYRAFCSRYLSLYPPFHLTVYLDTVEEKARAWLRARVGPQGVDDTFSLLTEWPDRSTIQAEERGLMRLARACRSRAVGERELALRLRLHARQYAGIPCIHDDAMPWTEEQFRERLGELLTMPAAAFRTALRHDTRRIGDIKRKQEVRIRELRMPVGVRRLFSLLGLAQWIRLEARTVFAISHHLSRPLFEEIARRTKRTAADIKWLTPEETAALLYGKDMQSQTLQDRKRATVFLYKKGVVTTFWGERAEAFMRRELWSEETDGTEIHGSVGNPGHAIGRVAVLRNAKDLTRVERGDVIVARMTTADLLPALRKAAAIVTDEGGITCHAAVLARELGIPCVIGTKTASKLLKTGDRVEVDASAGVVKIIT